VLGMSRKAAELLSWKEKESVFNPVPFASMGWLALSPHSQSESYSSLRQLLIFFPNELRRFGKTSGSQSGTEMHLRHFRQLFHPMFGDEFLGGCIHRG